MGNCLDALEGQFGFSTDSVFETDLIYAEGKTFLNVKAWQTSPEQLRNPSTAAFFPENECVGLENRADVAVGFTGGGPRGYLCAIGYLAGLRDLNLLDKVKYLGGISGSAWAIISFTYSQLQVDDLVLLGEITFPQELNIVKLNEMVPNCLRTHASRDLAEALEKNFKPGKKFSDVWAHLICDTYLRPVGIKPDHYFSYNADCVSDIKIRNPSLAKAHFFLPTNERRPFPIVGISLIGPDHLLPPDDPFSSVKREPFYFFEITPLYVGNWSPKIIKYDFGHGEESVMVGGAIEPIGFTTECHHSYKPEKGLGAGKMKDILSVPKPAEVFDLKDCTAMSSYASETLIGPDFVMKDSGSLSFNFWSCASENPVSSEMLVADGSYTQSIPLISFLQRRVKKIVLFFESTVPLLSSEEWNVDEDEPNERHIDKGFASFFGIFPRNEEGKLEFQNNQVFSSKDFNKVIKGLQEAQQKGEPIMYTTQLVTVENSFWGIPSGIHSEVMFSYLGHIKAWEDQLPQETQKQLGGNTEFSDFPFFPDNFNGITPKNANLLCNMAGWAVIRNKELFENIFSSCARSLPCS